MINEVAVILKQPDWRKIVLDVLVRFGIIQKNFTGRIVIHVSQGLVSATEVTKLL